MAFHVTGPISYTEISADIYAAMATLKSVVLSSTRNGSPLPQSHTEEYSIDIAFG